MKAPSRFITRLAGAALCLCALAACAADGVDETSTIAPTTTPYYGEAPSESLYFRVVVPPPGSILNVQDFREGKHAVGGKLWEKSGDLASPICIKLSAASLLTPGDDFSDADHMLDKLEFSLDGQVLSRPQKIVDHITLNWLEDEEGNRLAVAGGPFVFCWQTDLGAGVHTARFEVQRSSGDPVEYEWSFTLTDE